MTKEEAKRLESFRDKLRAAAEASNMTQEEIGLAMGYSRSSARQAVSRLLNPEAPYDPRLSTLLAFSQAIKRPLKQIIS